MLTQLNRRQALAIAVAGFGATAVLADEPSVATSLPAGDARIRHGVGDDEIVVTTTRRLAGAIHSVTWRGKEFIDSVDHGRQLQSASNLDCGSPIQAETFNPTEAGSRRDGAGPTSTSRLLQLIAADNQLQTCTQMAFWLQPGEDSGGHPARNTTRLSNHVLTKRVTIGVPDLPHVIEYSPTFSLPIGERHTQAVFEVVTGYMPAEFEQFWQFDPHTEQLQPLSDGPGEQAKPVVLATKNGSHAMGIYSPDRFATMTGPTYGRFRFERERVVKWNCVFRLRDANGVRSADYAFRTFVPVGDLEMVRRALVDLHARFVEGPQ